jgi:precorrin-6x reductase CbiJ/CobK/CbiD protein
MARQQIRPLRRGSTTGACAAAASRAAFTALLSGRLPDPASIRLPRGATVSFPLGLAELGEGRSRATFLVRLVDPPRRPLPLRLYKVVVGRGPFTLAEERHLFERHAIDALVCKASGGAATEPKIAAVRELSIPVVAVQRPAPELGDAVETVKAALDWLAGDHPFARAELVS